MLTEKSLDDWYRTINAIYLDRNFYRSLESIYLHFIEVAASLNTAGETSRKKHIVAEDFLPKTIAWFFTLCGRVGIPSVEKMIWAKFPNVCPYCRLPTHRSMCCKENDPSRSEVDWNELKAIADRTEIADICLVRSLSGNKCLTESTLGTKTQNMYLILKD